MRKSQEKTMKKTRDLSKLAMESEDGTISIEDKNYYN